MTPQQRDRLDSIVIELGEIVECLDVDEQQRELSLLVSAQSVIAVVARTEWGGE